MENTADEIKRLQRCINDLISVLALPALWGGSDSSHIVGTLLDVLLAMLRLDLAYARLSGSSDDSPIEVVRSAQRQDPSVQPQQVGQALGRWLTGDHAASRLVVPNPAGEGDVSIASFSLGLQDEVGTLVVGSRRTDFPTEIERLLLRVAVNQAGIGLQEARRSGAQKQVAEALEQRVAERTRQLTAVNEELRRSQAYLAEAQRLSHSGSFGWNVATSEIVWSEESFRIFDYDRATTPTVDVVLHRTHPEDVAYVKQTLERASRDEKDLDFEHRLVMPDGSIKHVHVMGHPHRDQSGGLEFVGALIDLTATKRAEEALRQSQADLAHVSRVTTMGEMAASIAHEVNQPLSGVVINANAGLRWLAAEPPDLEEVRDAIRRIMRDGQRASQVIARVRALTQKATMEKEPLDLNSAIQEVLGLAQGELSRTRVALRTAWAPDLPRVVGDRVQLQQVVLNLTLNGIDAMRSVLDRPREMMISTHREAVDRVRVVVKDSGIGIDPDKASQIFAPFYTTKPSGLGMGLSISRSIVENHGGRLWAVANDGPGTTFQFTV